MNAAIATPLQILHTPKEAADWLRAHAGSLQTDSRLLQPGQAFIAWPGAAHDARKHVLGALQHSAAACLAEAQDAEAFDFMQPGVLSTDQASRLALYWGCAMTQAPSQRHSTASLRRRWT